MSYDDFFISYCPTNGPALVSQDSTLGMAYMTEINGESRVFLSLSEGLGDTFSVVLPMEMTSETNIYQSHPTATITSNGNIHILWEDSRNGGDILYGKREIGQNYITDITTVNDSLTSSPEIAPKLGKDANDNLYAVWVDRRMGRHIRFSSTIAPDLSTKFENIPSLFKLLEPFQNTFNPITTIRFNVDVEKELFASLNVIDIRGHIVEILLNGLIESGQHEIQWDASTYSSGIFFISLTANGQTKTVKSVLVK